jgi:DNA polymerase I-like protein with 3'-5' exonuclease and polymerase domains/uracil-DNA glycosylase
MAVAERVSLPVLRGSADGADCEGCPFSFEGRPNRPVFSEHPAKPKWIIVGEGPGFNEVRLGRPFCLVPETKVLMADLTWKPLGEIVIGDRIIAPDEEGVDGKGVSGKEARKWRIATVTATYRHVAEAIEVRTERGSLQGSSDHPVLVRGSTSYWLEMGKLQAKEPRGGRASRIAFLSEPWAVNRSYEAAWLAGFMDGEGHLLGSKPRGGLKARRGKDCKVGFTQNAGKTYERAASMVRALGFDLNAKEEAKRKGVICNRVTIRGDLATTLRFLGEVRPERLIDHLPVALDGKSIRALDGALVLSRKPIGPRELIDITTTSGTFIANGFVVHNCGATGEVVMKLLARVGRSRDDVMLNNATLCQPPPNSPDDQRHKAAEHCKTRMLLELAKFPGLPVLALGAVAARSIIPKAALDAIDPPDVPESKQKRQKRRQRNENEEKRKHEKRLAKIEARVLKDLIIYQRKVIKSETRGKASNKYIDSQIAAVQPQLVKKAQEDAVKELALREAEKAKKPKKKKPIKITDIVGTCFDVDIDGTGVRPIIPAIHPAALLRGGGRSIAGSHTPDLAFVNLTYDFGKVDALAAGKNVRLDINVEYEHQDAERATWLLVEQIQQVFDEGEGSIDLETYVDDPDRHHALMAYVARIRAFGLSTKKKSISVLWELIAPWAQSYLQMMLSSEHVTKTYHNGLYDRTVLIGNGFEIAGPWHDTLLAHHSAFPGCAHGLQIVTSQAFVTHPWKSEFRNAEEDTEKLLIYNAKDTGATHALRPWVEILVKKNSNERTYEIDRKMSEIFTRMHLRGMPVDREVNTELLTTFSKNVSESREAVDSVARDPKLREQIWHYLAFEQAKKVRKADSQSFEDRYQARLGKIKDDSDKGKWRWKISGGQHVAALIQALGVQLTQVTEKGTVSTKKDVLEGLVNVPIIRELLTYRENDKLLSTFVWQIFDRFVDGQLVQTGFADHEDRIHPIWNIHKISGRKASYEPVVSNVPKAKWKKQPDGTMKQVRPNLRRQIRARPRRKLVGFDFSQLEARNLALLSGDEFLLHVFATGLDIHTECSRVVFSGAGGTTPFDRLDPITGSMVGDIEIVQPCEYCKRIDFHHEKCKLAKMKKQLRDLVKQVEYGAFYGGSPETLWKVLLKEGFNVRLVDVAQAISTLMRKMPGIVRWQRNTVAKAALPPYTIADFVLGRRRVFPMGQVDPNEALNFESQATAASIMDTGMWRMEQRIIDRGYKECDPIVQVHDAAAYECWEDDAEDVAADVKDCYEQEYERNGQTIPYPVDVKIADSWDGV